MPIKSFRGMMIDGAIQQLNLHTNQGTTGYRIKEFRLMAYEPGGDNYEAIIKIYKVPQTTATAAIDFSDNTMVAAGFFTGDTTQQTMKWDTTIFDNEVFNQDIFITYNDLQGTDAKMNFYIELEQIKLSIEEATVTTIKNIRNQS